MSIPNADSGTGDIADLYSATAEFYDNLDVYDGRPDVEFYIAMARQELDAAEQRGVPGECLAVLEVGCGTGRVLVPMARAGLEMVGVDVSPGMAARCEQALAHQPADVRARAGVHVADMRTMHLGRTFAMATTPFRSFQHMVDVHDQLAALGAIREHLVPGGLLVLDLFDPWLHALVDPARLEESPSGAPFVLADGRRVQRTERVAYRDYARQVIGVELIYNVEHPGERLERVVQSFPMRYFFRHETEHLLARAGFGVETVYADYQRTPFGAKYPSEQITIARRVG